MPDAAKPKEKPKGAEGVSPGDSVYVRHPKRGAFAVKVKATGKDGFIGRCDQGQKHRVTWDRYLGHRARMTHQYDLVEQGADGALVRTPNGRQRFIAGLELPEPGQPAGGAAPTPAKPDDPITGGLDRLKKAEPMPKRMLLLKAQPPAGAAPGGKVLAKKGAKPAKPQKPRPPMKHGDVVRFQHGEVQGSGKIVASGADGVTLQDSQGREHQVRHEHLIHPEDDAPPAAQGSTPASPPQDKPAPKAAPERDGDATRGATERDNPATKGAAKPAASAPKPAPKGQDKPAPAPTDNTGQFTFFSYEGEFYRRQGDDPDKGVDDILQNGEWVPFEGDDPLEPVLYGEECPDPTAGAPPPPANANAPQKPAAGAAQKPAGKPAAKPMAKALRPVRLVMRRTA